MVMIIFSNMYQRRWKRQRSWQKVRREMHGVRVYNYMRLPESNDVPAAFLSCRDILYHKGRNNK